MKKLTWFSRYRLRKFRGRALSIDLLDLLETIYGKAFADALAGGLSDRRELLQCAAQRLGLDLNLFSEQVAAILKLEFISEVSAIDLRLLPDPAWIERFRRFGAMPVVRNSRIVGLACVNPQLVLPLMVGLESLPIYLATWLSIARAIELSKEKTTAAIAAQSRNKSAERAVTAERVLKAIIEEVHKYSIAEVEVRFLPDQAWYEFLTSDGRLGRGDISPKAQAALDSLLTEQVELAANQSLTVVLAGERRRVLVSAIRRGSLYRLSWGEEAARYRENSAAPGPNVVPISITPATENAKSGSAIPQVLVLDDNLTFAAVLKRFLRKVNLDVVHATRAEEALGKLAATEVNPLAVICDVHMPGGDGFQFLKVFRGLAAHVDTPVIMLTSDDDVEVELRALTCGADIFITKDEDPRILCQHITNIVRRRDRQEAA